MIFINVTKNDLKRNQEEDNEENKNGKIEGSVNSENKMEQEESPPPVPVKKKRKNQKNDSQNEPIDPILTSENPWEDPEVLKLYKIRKTVLKIWGFNNEKLKQSWESYASDSEDVGGLYFSLAIFIEIICKYIQRKRDKHKSDVQEQIVAQEKQFMQEEKLERGKRRGRKQNQVKEYIDEDGYIGGELAPTTRGAAKRINKIYGNN